MNTKRKTASGIKTEAAEVTDCTVNRMPFPIPVQYNWLKGQRLNPDLATMQGVQL